MTDNIVTAAFSGGRRTRTEHLWQYDYGQVLRITGLELPETFEVHFSNTRDRGAAKTSIGTAEAVSVPDEFLTSGADIYAWVFLHNGADDGETEYMIIIPVRRRAKPSDDAPTPQEQSAITQAIAALNSAVVDVQEAVDAAADARTSAASAETSATAAAASEASVGADADRASEAAAAAETAQAGAETAQTGAESARDAAAQVLESIPADYTELSGSVSDLKSALNDAKEELQNSKAPFIFDSASGTIASFSDGADALPMKSLVAKIEPVQDLHGYDNPWPGGGGKNLLDPSKTHVFGTAASHYGIDVTYADDVFTFSGTATTSSTSASFNFAGYDDYSLSGRSLVIQYFEKTGTGTINNIYGLRTESENKIAITLDLSQSQAVNFSIKVSVSETSQSAYTPYSNICPISGWTGAKVQKTGVNVSDTEQLPPNSYWGGSYDRLVDLVNSLPVGTYTLSHKATVLTLPDSGQVQHGPFYVTAMVNGSQVPVSSYRTTTDNSPTVGKVYKDSTTFTITEANKGKCNHVYAYCDSSVHTGAGRGNYQIYNIQLELGSTATSYEPYQGESITIQLGQTVYGGTLDVTSGVLTVDRAEVTLDGSESGWLEYNGQNGFRRDIPDMKIASGNIGDSNWLSVHNALTSFGVVLGSNNSFAYFCHITDTISSVIDLPSWKTYLGNNPLQLVYPLATPITYQLTPTEVTTLLGNNNIWADTGNVEVEYAADLKTYIDSKIAAAVAALS